MMMTVLKTVVKSQTITSRSSKNSQNGLTSVRDCLVQHGTVHVWMPRNVLPACVLLMAKLRQHQLSFAVSTVVHNISCVKSVLISIIGIDHCTCWRFGRYSFARHIILLI